MGLSTSENEGVIFVSIVGGKFRQKATEDTEGAVLREYEDRDGNKKSKWELVHTHLHGPIQSIEFRDTDFGLFCNVKIDGIVMSLQTESQYFQQFAKKLPAIDLESPVGVGPYDFEKDGRRNVGLSIVQGGVKVKSYFWDNDAKEDIHGIPSTAGEETSGWDKDDWKMFFIKEKKFLIQFIKDNVIPNIPEQAEREPVKTPQDSSSDANAAFNEAYEADGGGDDIPF